MTPIRSDIAAIALLMPCTELAHVCAATCPTLRESSASKSANCSCNVIMEMDALTSCLYASLSTTKVETIISVLDVVTCSLPKSCT